MTTRHINTVLAPADRQSLGAAPRVIAGGGSYPNEPAGATVLTDWVTDFSAYSPPGVGNETALLPWASLWWNAQQGSKPNFEETVTVTDPTAPLETTTVGRTRFNYTNTGGPTGYGNGIEKCVSFNQLLLPSPQTNYKLYVSYWWRAASDFALWAGQLKHINLWDPLGGTITMAVSASVYDVNDPTHAYFPAHPPYYMEYYITNPATAVTINVPGPAVLANNTWYQFEWLIDFGTHRVKAWANGTLYINEIPSSWIPSGLYSEFSWDWTYGGNYSVPPWPNLPSEIYTYMTHFRVSRAATG